MITISYGRLKPVAFAYLILPVIIFFIGFVKFFFAVPACAALILSCYFALRKRNGAAIDERKINTKISDLLILAVIALVWCYLGGLNGFFFQSNDWPWRNAIYRDIVFKDWPVIYPQKGSALVYYIGFWLVPSLPAKIVMAITGSVRITWFVARMALWLWSAAGVFLVFILLNVYLTANSRLRRYFIPLLFILFSGMDIIGCLLTKNFNGLSEKELHIEWWANFIQYSSNTTLLYWVFNQTVVPWLAVICFLSEKTPQNYMLIGISCFCCGPLAFVGLVFLMLAKWTISFISSIKERSLLTHLKNTFTLGNLLILIFCFPALAVYYLCNLTVESSDTGYFIDITPYNIKVYIAFFALEAGIYLFLVWFRNLKNPFFYATALSLGIIPFFRLGDTMDFCMRASIPSLFVLFVFCAEALLDYRGKEKEFYKRLCTAALAVFLAVGAVTPGMEIYRGVYNCIKNNTVRLSKEEFESIGDLDIANNFTADNYTSSIFFKYFSK